MTEVKNPSTILSSNYFEVVHEITIKSTEVVNKAKATYDIVLKSKRNEKYDVEINRLKFLVNEKEIENKFPLISNLYFESIFPLQFNINDDSLELSNFNEVHQRVLKTDKFLREKHVGEGLEYISVQFLEQIENQEKTNLFIKSLPIVSIINLALKRYSKESHVDFNLKIPTIGNIFFKLKSEKNNKDSIAYNANQIDKEEFIKTLNTYRIQNKYDAIIEKEDINLDIDFSSNINYEDNNLNIVDLNTKCKIGLDKYFEYEENITIKSVL